MVEKDEPQASTLLMRQLRDAGFRPRFDGHISAGCDWVALDDAATGQFWFTSGEAIASNPVSEHGGWLVCHYPDVEDAVTGDGTVVYHSGVRDFESDTAAAVHAVRHYLTDPAPWHRNPRHHAECGPYVTAGEHLFRALVAAGLPALDDAGVDATTSEITVHPHGLNGRVVITGADGIVHHRPEDHPGWTAHLYGPGVRDWTRQTLYRSRLRDFDADTAGVVAIVRRALHL